MTAYALDITDLVGALEAVNVSDFEFVTDSFSLEEWLGIRESISEVLSFIDSNSESVVFFEENIAYLETTGILTKQEAIYLTDSISTTALSCVDFSTGVVEKLAVLEAFISGGAFNVGVLQRLNLSDKATITFLALVVQSMSLTDIPAYARHVLDSIRDGFIANGTLVSNANMIAALTLAIALDDENSSGLHKAIVEELEKGVSLSSVVTSFAVEVEKAVLEASSTANQFLFFTVPETVSLSATERTTALVKEIVESGVSFAIDFGMGGQVYSAYVMNTKNFALSEYQNFPFNSFAKVGTQYYAASEAGLYLLDGSTDAGEDVQATITLGAMDFTGERKTNVCEAFLALRNDGEIAIKVKTDDNIERWYRMSQESDVLRDRREKFARGVTSRFWTFSLENIDGADFEVHEMTFLPLVMKRRI